MPLMVEYNFAIFRIMCMEKRFACVQVPELIGEDFLHQKI